MVFGGCIFSTIAMEAVLKGDPQAGNLFSLSKTLLLLLQGLPGRFSGFKPTRVAAPLSSHMQFAALWSTMSILANYAFSFRISMTMFTLVRSSNLIATVVLGRLFFCYRYSRKQILCVCAVSIGVFLASMGEAKSIRAPSASCSDCSDKVPSQARTDDADVSDDSLWIWMLGMTLLALVQLLQGVLGFVQSGFYQKYAHLADKSQLSDEYLFTSQIVALVPLILMFEDLGLASSISAAVRSEATPFAPIPSRVAWLIFHGAADVVCLKGVFRTSSIVSPLTLGIILTVRKFLSTIVSVLWFESPWTVLHSIAAVLIFSGSLAYSEVADTKAADATKKSD
jgi:UDP-xylose/UDP-N-acetylglucosamine transporter B4